ncbi:DUF1729-domain-containing protein [Choiromyces venosus 120613-1]|uniref:DUF1729-domain-containing protein n=1 Tax=Choiromyces venosus 120613-1 TaxID=1336337 RepID=A0A3N4J5F1_9PEZI|nr:DUF1729-domain-containing protein [Choiromyces venosus 120613-1]
MQRHSQMPVTFVPLLDENFEFWFEKDSLWQREHLNAVVEQDFGRTRILQGPMAAKYSTAVKDICHGIYNGYNVVLTMDVYSGDESAIPVVEHLGSKLITSQDDVERVDGLAVAEEGGKTTLRVLASAS